MSNLLNDLKFATRQMLKNPGFTLITVLTLALGVGVNAAVFGVLYRVVLKPLPYPQSNRLIQVKGFSQEMGQPDHYLTVREYQTLETECKGFKHIAGFCGTIRNLSGVGVPVRAFGERISPEFLTTFGIAPVMGRPFTKEDYSTGRPSVVLISHRLWREQFGGRTDVIGQHLLLDSRAVTVCGVMPADFSFPSRLTNYWTPLVFTTDEIQATDYRLVRVIGRLEANVSPEQLQGQLQSVAQGYHTAYAIPDKDRVVFSGTALVKERIGSAGRVLWILFGAVSCVTLIVAANMTNLTISRLLTRRKEFAVRLALGADVWRISRQWLVETCLVSLVAGMVGMALTYWCIQLLRTFAPYGLPRANEIYLDNTIIGYGFLLSLVMGMGVSFLPLIRLLQANQALNTHLKSQNRAVGFTGSRSRFWLVAGQASMATVLLIGASLLWSSFHKVTQIDPGFSPDHLLSARVVLPHHMSAEDNSRRLFYRQLLDRLAALPDITDVGLVNALPLADIHFKRPLSIKNQGTEEPLAGKGLMWGNSTSVSINYFKLMGILMMGGRSFLPTDEQGAPVVIVSQSLAQRFFGDKDVIGRQIKIGPGQWPWMTIVGIVADVKSHGRDAPSEPTFYVPYIQNHLGAYTLGGAFIVAKTREAPEVAVNHLRAELGVLNPDLALANIETMTDRLYQYVANRRYHSGLMGLFAVLALILVVIGILGVISRTVLDRQREIGIRLALGSSRVRVFKLILKQGLKPVLIGILVGWLLALALHSVLSSLLFGVSASDPRFYLLVGTLLLLTAALACYIPARKATRFDPMEVLRYE